MLRLKLRPTNIPPLRQRHKDRLPGNNLAIHLIHRTRGILGTAKANESKPPRYSRLPLAHDMGTGDRTHGRKFLPKHIVIDPVVQILHVQIDALEFCNPIHLLGFVLCT
jgi:hypothetical protein